MRIRTLAGAMPLLFACLFAQPTQAQDKAVRKEIYGIVNGTSEDRQGWLSPIPVNSKQPVGV